VWAELSSASFRRRIVSASIPVRSPPSRGRAGVRRLEATRR
jgi:hypothetical protein